MRKIALNILKRLGYINGMEGRRFAPKENAARSEVSKMTALCFFKDEFNNSVIRISAFEEKTVFFLNSIKFGKHRFC